MNLCSLVVLCFHNLYEKNMVNDGVAPRLEITFHIIHSYRVHGNRSKLEISALFPPQNWKNKFGSMNSHFFLFGHSTLTSSMLHAHRLLAHARTLASLIFKNWKLLIHIIEPSSSKFVCYQRWGIFVLVEATKAP